MSMMRPMAIALATILLPGVATSAPTDPGETTLAGPQSVAAQTQGTAVVRPPATETLHGVVESVDQGNDTIKLRLSHDTVEQFKVQDGLIFNSVRFGDPVEVSVQNISGARTIVELSKE